MSLRVSTLSHHTESVGLIPSTICEKYRRYVCALDRYRIDGYDRQSHTTYLHHTMDHALEAQQPHPWFG